MSSKLTHLLRQFVFLFFVVLNFFDAQSQCNPENQLPGVQCVDAPLPCLQNACYTTVNQPDLGYPGFCGPNTLVHNPQYFEIIPVQSCIEIHIHIDDCDTGYGLQAALVSTCDWLPCPGSNVPCQDVLDCDPGTFPGGTMIMDACGLTPGVSLWLLIDGSNASICQYTIEFVEGIFEPQIEEELTFGEAFPASVCQGFNNLQFITGPSITNAHGYLWDLEWNGQTLTSTLPEIEIDIANDAPPGTWNVCVQAFSGCDTTDSTYCFPVVIYEINDVQKDTTAFCPEVFPFLWHNLTIPGPGTFAQSFSSPEGCFFDSIWVIEELPEVPVGELSFIECLNENLDPFIFEGVEYDSSGVYWISFPGMGLNGCDSFLYLNLTLEGVAAFVEYDCSEGQKVLVPHILEMRSTVDSLTYEWYDCGFNELISTNHSLNIDSSDCYCLVINTGFCSDTICSTYIGNPCESTCDIVQQQSCIGDSVLLSFESGDSLNADFHWLVDLRGRKEVYFTGNDSLWITYDSTGCYRISLTVERDTSTLTCLDSICILPPTTEVDICCDHITCALCTELTFTLTGMPPWTIILSDGNLLDTISGILSSPYVHPVCVYQDTTIYSIIDVFGSGDICAASVIGDSISIEYLNPGPFPIITQNDSVLCASNDVIVFGWYECNDTLILGSTQCFNPGASGCYCVEFTFTTNLDTCGAFHTCEDFIVGTVENDTYSEISIWPNPVNRQINLQLPENFSFPIDWHLYDYLGVEHQNGQILDKNVKLDLGNAIPPGLYFIKLTTGTELKGLFKIAVE